MKVLQLITGLAMGGAEKMVVDLSINGKNSDQHEFIVVSLTDQLDRKNELEKNGIQVYSLSLSKNLISLRNGIRRLRDIVESHQIDLIHVHMFHGFLLALLSGLSQRLPVVFTGHNTNFGNKIREYVLWATKRCRKYDIIFAHNQVRFFHKAGNRTRVIPNGVNVDSIIEQQKSVRKNDVFTFINVGNIETQKNQIAFIPIALELKKKNKIFQIKIVGEGSKLPELEEAIKKHGLENEIILLGKRMDVPVLMAAAHCFVMPSLWEGMPITILEAGVSKIPVISTNVGNNASILANNRGIVAELPQFQEYMIHVMENYSIMRMQTELLYSHIINQYSIESIYGKHISIYLEAINN